MIGVLVFIATLLVLVLVHEFGHFAAARLFGVGVEEFGFGFPPAIIKKKFGQTIYSFNWIPLGGFVRIKGEDKIIGEPDSYSSQSPWRRAVIILSGVLMNLLLVVVLFSIGYTVGLPQELGDTPPTGARVRNISHHIAAVMPASPADGVLKAGDVIVSIDEKKFQTLADLQSYIRAHREAELNLAIDRDSELYTVSIQPALLKVEDGEVYGVGVSLFTTGVISYPVYRAPLAAAQLTAKLFGIIAVTLGELVAGLFRGAPVPVDIAGPVGIALITTQVVGLGWIFILQFVAVLSLNLAFINLLPFPALDGGRLLFIIIEIIRRRPVSEELEGRVHRWGFTVLIILVMVVTYFDLRRLGGVFDGLWDRLREIL